MRRIHFSQYKMIVYAILMVTLVLLIFFLYRWNIIEHRSFPNASFDIETYVSANDQDQDGIDDQTDILQGVRAYVSTKPLYKSKYYDTGYPNDQYGVCTDVVAFGLINAGFDLKKLVNDDILKDPESYDTVSIDENIDFRRVRNLYIYFENNASKLTNDIYDIEQWQGGDIAIFENHVGVVSDKRNRNGVNFIIHHFGILQIRYEEDILEYRDDIIGHYRIN